MGAKKSSSHQTFFFYRPDLGKSFIEYSAWRKFFFVLLNSGSEVCVSYFMLFIYLFSAFDTKISQQTCSLTMESTVVDFPLISVFFSFLFYHSLSSFGLCYPKKKVYFMQRFTCLVIALFEFFRFPSKNTSALL